MQYQVIQTQTGYAVAYRRPRGEFLAVCDCASFPAAEEVAKSMNEKFEREMAAARKAIHHGNRYLRKVPKGFYGPEQGDA